MFQDFSCKSIIISSDFNCVQNPILNKKGDHKNPKPRPRSTLLKYIEEYYLNNIWRTLNRKQNISHGDEAMLIYNVA